MPPACETGWVFLQNGARLARLQVMHAVRVPCQVTPAARWQRSVMKCEAWMPRLCRVCAGPRLRLFVLTALSSGSRMLRKRRLAHVRRDQRTSIVPQATISVGLGGTQSLQTTGEKNRIHWNARRAVCRSAA